MNEIDLKGLEKDLERAKEVLLNYGLKSQVRLISHHDADGISSAAILITALKRMNIRYVLSIVPQLTDDFLIDLSKTNYELFIFSDLGSNSLNTITNYFKKKMVIILDHHEIGEGMSSLGENIVFVNPHKYREIPYETVSGSGLSYLFAKKISEKNKDLSPLAIVGAIGDIQEVQGKLIGINKTILDEAVENGFIKVEKSIKLIGVTTKPLHKVLQHNNYINIEGVSGSESGSIQFLKALGIDPKGKYGWKRYYELSQEEKEKLSAAIIMHNKGDYKEIIVDRYIIPGRNIILGDARDLATALNACGRLGKPNIGIAACLGKKGIEEKLLHVIREYRKAIVTYLEWVREAINKEENIRKGDGYIIINAKDKIIPSMIGTIMSILSNDTNKEMIFIGMARDKEHIKVSMRSSFKGIDLKKIIDNVIEKIGGVSGGHLSAAGALIPIAKENIFIAELEKELINLEEKVIH